MAWSTAVVMIVVMSLCIPIYALWVKGQRYRHGRGANDERLERELAELRTRVETLERIVTDQRYGLDREFERMQTGTKRSG